MAGADVNAIAGENTVCFDHFKNALISGTPLHRATARNHIVAVRALLNLETPADPFAKGGPDAVAMGMDRPTPICWASASHEAAMLHLFLDRTGDRELNCNNIFSLRNAASTLYSMALWMFGGYM